MTGSLLIKPRKKPGDFEIFAFFPAQRPSDYACFRPSGYFVSELNVPGTTPNQWYFELQLPTVDPELVWHVVNDALYTSTTSNGTIGPVYTDVQQGHATDCYLMSALGQLALQDPLAITSMITLVGTGNQHDGNLYNVRFYDTNVSGAPTAYYVTVDSQLPEQTNGQFYYANPSLPPPPSLPYSSGPTALWVAIIEKAYAELAAEGWSRPYNPNDPPSKTDPITDSSDSYTSINDGVQLQGTLLCQILGKPVIPNVQALAMSNAITAIEAGDIVTIRTDSSFSTGEVTGSGGGSCLDGTIIDPDHSYILVNYDPNSQEFILENPYYNDLSS
jgi:hypothetical protein